MRRLLGIFSCAAFCAALCATLYATMCGNAFAADVDARWQSFKERFISSDGRVIDWQNEHISHSEGQGYVLLIALEMDDKETFDRVLTWSDQNLGHVLRAWSWGHKGAEWNVLDHNNATDGDIFHAWALLRAGKKWNNPQYSKAGKEIMDAIRNELIDKNDFLLPARFGFQHPKSTRLNLSYYVFSALRYFAAHDPKNRKTWNELYDKGLDLYFESLQNPAKLPPDWLSVDNNGKLMPLQGPDAVFGFEAICIPVYLAWAKEKKALKPLRPFITRIVKNRWMPQSVNLLEPNFLPAPDNLEGGIGHYASIARAAEELGMKKEAKILWQLADESRAKHQRNYYGEVLYLLARVM